MITDLEQAITIHLDNQRKSIDKHQHPLVTSKTQIHIRTIEQASRTSKALEAKIASTKQSMRDCQLIEIREQYYVKLQAPGRLLAMVKTAEEDQPLDGLAY